MKRIIWGIQIFSIGFYLSACGGGSEPDSSDLFDADALETSKFIEARGSWQCMGMRVKGDEEIWISSTGTWSGGQRDRSAPGSTTLSKILYTDADGGNGLVYNTSGAVVPGTSLAVVIDPSLCGSEPCNYTGLRSGPYVDSSLSPAVTVTIPGVVDSIDTLSQNLNPLNNRGPACSSMSRIVSVRHGQASIWVKANECLPTTRNRLIGKIVPPNTDPQTVTPFDVGKKYEINPYTIPASTPPNSEICFRANDSDAGTGDNEGFLQVTVSR